MKQFLQKHGATLVIVLVFIVGGAVIGYQEFGASQQTDQQTVAVSKEDMRDANQIITEKAEQYMYAPEIVNPSGFFNIEGDDLQLADLIGDKVILVDFWTYSCINCQRTAPYLVSWYDKYRDQGLEIVGIHSPEFAFEKDPDNVANAIEEFGIEYPVVMDNDFATWRNYANRYWPRKYLIDIDGFVVYDHIGEGAYAETERVIQDLLKERNERLGVDMEISSDVVSVQSDSRAAGVEFSPETYFGAWRNEYLANGTPGVEGVEVYELPEETAENKVYFDGEWNISREYARNTSAGASIVYKYAAQKVFMVGRADQDVTLTIKRDGEVVKTITVNEDRLYTIIDDQEDWGRHELEIIVEDPGLEIFTFTFG